jgi:Fe2+ or Zn2+ uptake regulation protein
MTLDLAILNVLSASPRAISAQAVASFAGNFTGKEETLSDVKRTLEKLEREGFVRGTSDPDRGSLWKETADGRLRAS